MGSIVDFGPDALDLGGKLWTRRKVCVLAERLFGVSFTEQGMGRLLRRVGFGFQRPDKRAIEADPEAMRPERIELHFLSAYAPHLNPDELVNADLKSTLTDQVITDRAQIERSVRAFFHRVQKLPAHVLGYFQALHTKYATSII